MAIDPDQALDLESVKRFIAENSELTAEEYARRLDVTVTIHAYLAEQFFKRYPEQYVDYVSQQKP